MPDQRGRCANIEFCSVAVQQKVQTVPEGEPFACAKCGDRLHTLESNRPRVRRVAAAMAQAAVLVIGSGVVFWYLRVGAPSLSTNSAMAEQMSPASSGVGTIAAPALTPGPINTGAGIAPPNSMVTLVTVDPPPPPPPPPVAEAVAPPLLAVPVAAPAPAPAPAPTPAPSIIAMATPPGTAPVLAQAAVPAPPPVPSASISAPPSVTLVRMAGSNLLASKLARRLASGYLALIGDTDIAAIPYADGSLDIAGMQTGTREVIKLVPSSSAAGFNALLRGNADFAMASRKIRPMEAERLLPVGDLTDPANEQIVAVQGVAVIVHPSNRIQQLTVPQLKDILAGRIRDWAAVYGKPGPISLYTLADQDGTLDVPQDILVTHDNLSPATHPIETEQGLAATVALDRNAIGFVTAGNHGPARILAVAEPGAAPVLPFELAVKTEDYPLTRRFYFYSSSDKSNGPARRFADYVTSPAGQAVVEAAGLVALNLRPEPMAVPDGAPDRFRQLVAGSTRVPVDFRFQPGSTDLDYRGTRDLDRLVAYLKAQRIAPGRLILAAFADNFGSAAINQTVSQKRGDAVAAALTRVGVSPGKVASFSSDLPVADNSTAEGRERNRRVEVYLAP